VRLTPRAGAALTRVLPIVVPVLGCALIAASSGQAAPKRMLAPDDFRFEQQWQLARDSVMGAQRAWRLGRGGPVTIAIVDSGVNLRHPDLRDNLWTNPREIAGNGIDDDGDGRVDDVHGWDFANGDADPADDNGHGTHVAGIAAARGDNGIGVAGVAWRARIMAVKAVDASAQGSSSTVAEAVRYAVARGARIVVLALAGSDPGSYLESAIREAADRGVLVVCAAGNGGRDVDAQPVFPAAFDLPNVISVAATSRKGALSRLSNFGRATIDIATPGEGIISTSLSGVYERRSGTSMAAASVAGAAALVAAAAPGISAAEIRSVLLSTARGRGALPISGGTLDLAAAMRRAKAVAAR
jgi:subtilisin family serine protease